MGPQAKLPLPDPPPSIGQARRLRERQREAGRVRKRRQFEERAAALFARTTRAAGVDALVADVAFDRSLLYAMGSGKRPAQLAPFLAALEDRAVGPDVLRELAAVHGLLLVGPEGQAAARGLVEIVADLLDELQRAGALGDVERERERRRKAG